MFERKINLKFLALAQIAYGGEFFLKLKDYKLKEINTENTVFEKVTDTLLIKKNIDDFYSYKNSDNGFTACVFENKNHIVILSNKM